MRHGFFKVYGMTAKVKLEKKPYLRVVRNPEPEQAEQTNEQKKKNSPGKIVMPAQPARYIKAKKHDCL
jgi:hypothetical protein